jgi:hypothetical protein
MSLFKDTVSSIKEKKKRVEEGKVNCIPFINFPRLRAKIPGLIPGTGWIVTASTGVGKSQFTKSIFILEPLQWVLDNPDKGISIKIMYFALEESKEEFMYSMVCHRLKSKHNLVIDPLELSSMYEDNTVDDKVLKLIEDDAEYFETLTSHVDIVDSISNPFGIYKYIRRYSKEHGTHYYYNFKTDKKKIRCITEDIYHKVLGKEDYAYSHYIPNNPDEYVVCIVDHFSLLQQENEDTLHQAMTKMSANYGRKQITKHYNYIFVNVQQQMAATEENVFTNAGKKIIEKLKPSLQGLADNKLTSRDAHVVFGLFAPIRYAIDNYMGYDIKRLDDQYRSLIVLKNRIGRGNLESPLFFNGASTQFKEMPLPEKMTENYYKSVEEIQNKMR